MQSILIYGLMPSEQQMIVGIMLQPMNMKHVQCQDSVNPEAYQQYKTNTILDVQHMS